MSSSPGNREVAHRLFAAEFDDADYSYSESDEERAPNYVVTPTGARVNRLFFVGVLTETERVNEDMLRGRIVDPTGAFVTYAGQYQPDQLAFLERAESPSFLAVTGKARTFQPEDSDRVYTSARPESISEVDAETRDRWVVQAAERTVDRVRTMASALESGRRGDDLAAALVEAGVDGSLAEGIALALDHYGTTPAYLAEQRDLAVQAAETVTGDRDEVDRPSLAPADGDGDAASLADPDLVEAIRAAEGVGEATTEPSATDTGAGAAEAEPGTAEATAEAGADTEATGVEADVGEADATGDADTADAEPEPVEATADAAAAEPATGADAGTDEADGDGDDLGDFEPGEFDADEQSSSSPRSPAREDAGDVDEEDVEDALTDEERREVEENFDTDFSTGNEVGDESTGGDTAGDDSVGEAAADGDPVDDDPEEADRPEEADEDAPETAESDSTAPGEPDTEVAPGAEEDPEAQYDEEPEPSDNLDTGVASADEDAGDGGEVDVEAAVMETMAELDGGDGADHDEVVQTVADEYGVSVDDAEAAVEDALMSGQCYEPADGKLKPI